ncbi:MAG: FMN-binding protein, partial [Planctomycetota bacterium]
AHFMRVALVIALLWLLPSPTRDDLPLPTDQAPTLNQVRGLIEKADSIEEPPSPEGFWSVLDADGNQIAAVARSLPAAVDVIGYRGPSEALIALDDQLHVVGVDLIQSSDTDEHVEAVKADKAFFDQFRRWSWGEVDQVDVDGVSSATLTSLAFANGILKRMGGDRPSLVFPDWVERDEVERWFPDVVAVENESSTCIVLDGSKAIGRVIRTGPLSDDVMGYQGPTELLLQVDDAGVLQKAMLRSSFDNQPYVRYCKTEYGFWAKFQGKTIPQLAELDIEAEGIEGVSGATMTSLAIAETIVASAKAYQKQTEEPAQTEKRLQMRWSAADVACMLTLLLVPVFQASGWFRRKTPRLIWLITVICVIGFWSGNLISMALVAGWGAEGVAWRLAPGLAAVAVVALLSPPLGKSNPYCNHLCPHGALQQVIRPKPKSSRHRQLPKRLTKVLAWLPGSLLALGYVMILMQPSADLSSWEPFHAYLFRLAPLSAFLLSGVTLAFSAFVPMGFCRMGCPTGRLIDYVRRNAQSGRFRFADAVAIVLLAAAIASAWSSP